MKIITLTNSTELINVLDEDYEKILLLNTKWVTNGNQIKSTRMFEGSGIILSRFIMGLYDENYHKRKYDVDHIDGNIYNNDRANLRLASTSQNCGNRRIRKDNRTGFKGVRYCFDKYIPRVMKDGVAYHLGMFTCPIQTALAHDKKARELFGRFAKCNYTIT
jgi:hypothetical protein